MTNPLHPEPSYRRLRMALSWAATLIWAALIFQLSTQAYGASFTAWLLELFLRLLRLRISPTTFSLLHLLVRKCAHLTEYAIFAVLVYHSFEADHPHEWRTRRALTAVITAGLYSLTDEYHQSFQFGRTASLLDCGIDTAGASLGMLILYADGWLLQAKSNRAAASAESNAEMKKGVAGE